jgi:hypothetical protein
VFPRQSVVIHINWKIQYIFLDAKWRPVIEKACLCGIRLICIHPNTVQLLLRYWKAVVLYWAPKNHGISDVKSKFERNTNCSYNARRSVKGTRTGPGIIAELSGVTRRVSFSYVNKVLHVLMCKRELLNVTNQSCTCTPCATLSTSRTELRDRRRTPVETSAYGFRVFTARAAIRRLRRDTFAHRSATASADLGRRARERWLIVFRRGSGHAHIYIIFGWCWCWYSYRLRKPPRTEGMRVDTCTADVRAVVAESSFRHRRRRNYTERRADHSNDWRRAAIRVHQYRVPWYDGMIMRCNDGNGEKRVRLSFTRQHFIAIIVRQYNCIIYSLPSYSHAYCRCTRRVLRPSR